MRKFSEFGWSEARTMGKPWENACLIWFHGILQENIGNLVGGDLEHDFFCSDLQDDDGLILDLQ